MLIFILLFGQTMLQAETLVGPTIEVWYGDTQSFGNNGEPQVWCNILGNVSDSDGSVTGLEYTLNGGSPVTLSIGGDGRRLLSSGDFNVDLAVSDLLSGANSVVITATDNDGNMTMKTVTVNYTPGNVWPNPYSIDWSTLGGDETLINDVAHVVDGEFELTPDGIRTTSPGYDRLIGIGNKTWDNYEVLVPVTIHSMPGGAGVGVLLRWTGHTDTPVTCAQPKCGYLPLGDIAWYRPGALEFYEGSSTSRSLSIGTTYLFRAQVDSDGSGNTYYKLRVWEQGTAEPATWDLEDTVGPSDKQNGCLLLISHMADVTFGNVTITPGSLSLNNPQVQLSNGNTEATITWTTNQPTDSRIDYGPSCSFEDGFVEDATMTTSHSLNLTGLSPNTIYRYELTSENTGGEVTSGCLTFSTFTAGIVSDDFCEATLNPVWTFDDPLADGSYQLTGSGGTDSWLEISVPAGTEHQIYTSGIQAPNLLQPVNNADFEVEVKFESPVVTPEYQEQGILVKESANKYLRFEFFSKSPGNTHIYAQGFDLPTASSAFVNTDIAPSNTYPLYMRVKRTGTTWEQSYSFDGTTWMTAATFVYDLTPTMIGPYAGNALNSGSPAHTAQIDYFENLADPLEYEDNCSSMLPPVLAAIGNQILDEGNSLMIGLSATDPDGSDANLVFSESGLPAFATLVDNNDGTASLNINPLLGDAGTYPVTITVTDEDNLTDTESFDIVVNSPAPPSGLVSDDFCRHYLEEDYWTFVDPQADGSYGFTGFYTSDAWLEISVPSGSAHELWVNGIQAPHIIQAANDVDLDVTVKFESPLNAPQYQEQGMLFKQDDYNFLRFEFYSNNSNTMILAGILSSGTNTYPLSSSLPINTSIEPLNTAPLWMRVTRVGDQWSQYWSADGMNWTLQGSFTAAMNISGVGLYAGNAGGFPAHTAQFDYFETADDPIAGEDSCQPFAAVCMNTTVQLDVNGEATIVPADVDGGSTGYDLLEVYPNEFDCGDIGNNMVILYAFTDEGGLTNCTATVTVEDNLPPTALCKNRTESLSKSGRYKPKAEKLDDGSYDNCGIASLSVSPTVFFCSDIGVQPVTLTVTDVNGNQSSCVSMVTIEDQVVPKIRCPLSLMVNQDPVTCMAIVNHDPVLYVDNCAGAVLNQIAGLPNGADYPVGVTTNTYEVVDGVGLSKQCSFNVTVVGAPECAGPDTVEKSLGDSDSGAQGLRAFPNPFKGNTLIEYQLDMEGPTSLQLYDLNGKLLQTLQQGIQTAGLHQVELDATENHLAPGVYFIRLQGPTHSETIRLIQLD